MHFIPPLVFPSRIDLDFNAADLVFSFAAEG